MADLSNSVWKHMENKQFGQRRRRGIHLHPRPKASNLERRAGKKRGVVRNGQKKKGPPPMN